jgi:hypothetical protein
MVPTSPEQGTPVTTTKAKPFLNISRDRATEEVGSAPVSLATRPSKPYALYRGDQEHRDKASLHWYRWYQCTKARKVRAFGTSLAQSTQNRTNTERKRGVLA